jgi:hypothetical protein
MFGPSAVFNPATHVPHSGKSVLVKELTTEFTEKPETLTVTPFVASMIDATAAQFQLYIEATNNDASKLRKLCDVLHGFLDEQDIAVPYLSGGNPTINQWSKQA